MSDDVQCKREDCGHLQSVHAEDGMGRCSNESCGCPQMQTFQGGGGSGGGGGAGGPYGRGSGGFDTNGEP